MIEELKRPGQAPRRVKTSARIKTRMRALAASGLGCLAILGAVPAHGTDELMVMMTRPSAGKAVFGSVEISADILQDPQDAASDPVVAVDFFVDDRFVDRLSAPPWTTRHDVGERPVAHRFEVVATTKSGKTASAVLESRAVRVDLEIESALQQLYITVERRGERVEGLGRDDFRIFDDGEPQRTVTSEGGDVPMAALVLVDASDSMHGGRLKAATAGASAFVDGMHKLDQAQMLLFSDRILHQTPFTSFPEVLKAGLSGVEADGGTSLDDHLFIALERLESLQGRRVVILLSDGVDVSSLLRMEDVDRVARRSEALIYWIRPGGAAKEGRIYTAWRDDDQHRRELELLERMVERSGGRIVDVKSVQEAEPAFEKILAELRRQYVVGYYPNRDLGDGAWHKVEVKVNGDGLHVRAREGYVDR